MKLLNKKPSVSRWLISYFFKNFLYPKNPKNPIKANGQSTTRKEIIFSNIAGKKVRKWYLTRNMADVFDLFDACGCAKDEIDENNPPVQELVGKTVDAILYTKESPKFKEPTLEQRAQGARVGDPILGADGQPIKFCEIVIDRVLGPVTV